MLWNLFIEFHVLGQIFNELKCLKKFILPLRGSLYEGLKENIAVRHDKTPLNLWPPLKIVIFPDLCVRTKIKMLTYTTTYAALFIFALPLPQKKFLIFRGSL